MPGTNRWQQHPNAAPPAKTGLHPAMLATVLIVGGVAAVVFALVAVGAVVAVVGDEEGSGNSQTAQDDGAPLADAESEEEVSESTDAESSPTDEGETEESAATAEPAPVAEPATESAKPKPQRRTYLVTRVIDGDTVDLGNGETVRVIGIDTPERGGCGYLKATERLRALVEGKRVVLTKGARDNRDRYDRLLRYLDIGTTDAGLRLIKSGLAIARYDSRDGYGRHPREDRYVAADRANRDITCPTPTPEPQPLAEAPAGNCAPGYSGCVPPYPPDVNCADVNGPIRVTGSDPHGLDRDGDGIACE